MLNNGPPLWESKPPENGERKTGTRRGNGIPQGVKVEHFTRVYLGAAWERSQDPDSPLMWRVYNLGLFRADENGCAHFDRGEMMGLLESYDLTTGEVFRPESRALTRAVKTLCDAGQLHEGSNLRKLHLAGASNGHKRCSDRG